MTKYTDEDVQRLVHVNKDIQYRVQSVRRNGLIAPIEIWTVWPDLDDALKPFQPDPEKEVIEVMAQAMAVAIYEDEDNGAYHCLARVALDAYRKYQEDHNAKG